MDVNAIQPPGGDLLKKNKNKKLSLSLNIGLFVKHFFKIQENFKES